MIIWSLCELSVFTIDFTELIDCPYSDEEVAFAWSAREWWRDAARLVFLVVSLTPSQCSLLLIASRIVMSRSP